jgi:putative ABC transport system substrate-binding protein
MNFGFAILDFGLRNEHMKMKTSIRSLDSDSDNLKSKTCTELSRSIQNLKWAGFLAIIVLLLGCVGMAHAQQAKPARIGVLLQGGAFYEAVDGLRQGLKELGYEEGKRFVLDIRDSKGDVKAVEEAARNLEREKVILIYAFASSVVTAAKKATTEVPIVFNVGSDPVTGGLVESFVKPGGRLTGIHYLARDLTGKRLEILKEILPKLRSVLTIYDPANRVSKESAQLAREEAKRLGLKFMERHVSSVEEVRSVLKGLKAGEADAFFYISDAMVGSQSQFIIDTAIAKKLATMFQEQGLVTRGGLASYGQSYFELGRLSAKYVQKILSGAQPRDLRIETVEDVELAINLKTAKQLGLTIPPQMLARANKVIK